MADTKHTPGPHRLCVKAPDDIFIRSPDGIVIAVLTDRASAEADGRLYATAPELLEALEDLLAAAWPSGDKQTRTGRAIMKARAALTKAGAEGS